MRRMPFHLGVTVMRMLRHGRTLSLCGLPFFPAILIGLQTWFALKVDHESRLCCTSKGAPHAVPLRIEDCKSGGGSAGHIRNRFEACFINRVVVATGSLSHD